MSELNTKQQLKFLLGQSKKSAQRRWERGSLARKTKELFLISANDKTYDPLPGRTWIRLLTLKPGSLGSVIQCTLRHVDLTQKPVYMALSYTWKLDPSLMGTAYSMAKTFVQSALRGDGARVRVPDNPGKLEQFKTIMCDGRAIRVFPNLYNALLQLRQKHPGDYWIDALCINQEYVCSLTHLADGLVHIIQWSPFIFLTTYFTSDLEERAFQVQLMNSIYHAADIVFVWLGTSSRLVRDGVPYLEDVAQRKIEVPPLPSFWDEHNHELRADMSPDVEIMFQAYPVSISIASREWFKRVWVVQELCWAQNVRFLLAEAEMSPDAVATTFRITQSLLGLPDTHAGSYKGFPSRIRRFGVKHGPIWAPQYDSGTFEPLFVEIKAWFPLK